MSQLDFTQPAQTPINESPIYDPAVALEFFKSAGKPESVAERTILFAEDENGNRILLKRDKMYLLLDGEVGLVAKGKAVGTVKQGEIFGEIASITGAPRTATAVTKSPCRVIALDDKQFQAGLQKKPEFALMLMSIIIGRLRATIAALHASGALSGSGSVKESRVFDKKLLGQLAHELDEPVRYERGKVILTEGQVGVFMYVVMEGRVAVSIRGSVVEKIGPGGVFGEMALVDQSPRAASATAETDCALLAINRNAFLGLMKGNPAFGASILGAVGERARYMASRLK